MVTAANTTCATEGTPHAAKRRILFVSLIRAWWGGSEVLWSAAAEICAQRGHATAAFFAFYKETREIAQLCACGVVPLYGTPPPRRWWRRALRPWPANPFAAALRSFAPDLVVFSQGNLREARDEMRTCARWRVPFAVINQAMEPTCSAAEAELLRETLPEARHIWFVSDENLATARQQLGSSLPQATVLPNAYLGSYDPVAPWPEDKGGLRLACVARIDAAQKGQDLLLEVLSRPHWRGRDLRIDCYGDGPDAASLSSSARQLDLPNLRFRGTTDDRAKLWSEHHALILPSRFEGMSLAMIEAMLHGRPAIMTPVGGTQVAIRNNETGFLAPSISADGLDNALERAWRSRDRLQAMGAAAKRHIQSIVKPDFGSDMADRILGLVPTLSQ